MPVNGRGLGQPVREPHLENVSHVRFERRPGNPAVESPRVDSGARGDRPSHRPRLQLDRDDLAAVVWLLSMGSAIEGYVRVGWRSMLDGAVLVMVIVLAHANPSQ